MGVSLGAAHLGIVYESGDAGKSTICFDGVPDDAAGLLSNFSVMAHSIHGVASGLALQLRMVTDPVQRLDNHWENKTFKYVSLNRKKCSH